MGRAHGQKQNSLAFLKKKHTYCQSVTLHVLLAKYIICSSNYQYIIKIKVKKVVYVPPFLCSYIYLCYLKLLSVFLFICIYLQINTDKYTNNYIYTKTNINTQIIKQC